MLKQQIGNAANSVAACGFAITLTSIDTLISISVGSVGIVAAIYSVLWHRAKIKKLEQGASDEPSDR